MSTKRFSDICRAPRHEAHPCTPSEVRAELTSRDPVVACPARLLNVSRNGMQITVGQPVANRETVTVRVRDDHSGLDVALRGSVRWQRSQGPRCWSLGCQLEHPLSYELMGELFLSGILDAESAE